jgi:hypothetical protein
MRILGVNGIHNWSWSKDSFTDRLLEALSHRHETVDVHYPRMTAVFAYFDFAIKRRAKKIIEANQSPSDILIAHSFGCLASIYAMREGARFDKVFFFGAAAEQDEDIPDAFNHLYNIHSAADGALSLGEKLPFHKFGALGRDGYTGSNQKVINVPVSGMGHNDYVSARNLCEWIKFIESEVAK